MSNLYVNCVLKKAEKGIFGILDIDGWKHWLKNNSSVATYNIELLQFTDWPCIHFCLEKVAEVS